MSRRIELEKEIAIAQKRIENAPATIPKDVMLLWTKELDSLLFELNNLYDDNENEQPN